MFCNLVIKLNEMNFFFLKVLSVLFLIVSVSCKKEINTVLLKTKSSKIKYAKGFDIIDENGIKKLIIKSAFQNSKEIFIYTIEKNNDKTLNDSFNQEILVPVNKIVVTSTTHIPMVELLNEERAIIGFPFGKYVSSEKTRNLLEAGKITEIGNESSINTEILLDLNPELVVGYGVSSADKTLNTIEKAGIKVVYNGDWLEENPLGRAEWIKFFGVLFDKEKQADSIFNVIEANYIAVKKKALKSIKKGSILSGAIMSNDIWNLPAGESFEAQFLKDANLNYLWKDTKGKGSLSLSFESVFDKGGAADFWIAPGYFSSKEQLLKSNNLYARFKAFQNDHIYTSSTKKGKTGGIIYYELATTRPDLVLKDIVKITNPSLFPNYTLTFFAKML